MLDESLPQLTKAPIPVQTHTLRLEERTAKGKALRDVAARQAQKEWKPPAFEDALADFSVAYADQNQRDHAALVAAVRQGKIEARLE